MGKLWSHAVAGVAFLGAVLSGPAAHSASLPGRGDEAQADRARLEAAPQAVTRAVRLALRRVVIADQNHDGMISDHEATRYYDARFDIMDLDHDGGLSWTEFVEARPATSTPAAARDEAGGDGRGVGFDALDLDGSGGIDREEFARALLSSRRSADAGTRHRWRSKAFAILDRSGDSVLSRREFAAAGDRHFAESDANGDGRVTIWEFLSRLPF